MYLFVYICVHFCIFVYISVYSHLSSKDAPRDLLQNERLESFCGGLWLGIQPFLRFLYFREFSLIFHGIGCIFVDFPWNSLYFHGIGVFVDFSLNRFWVFVCTSLNLQS